MRTIAFIAIAMVLVFATIIEAKKSKRCKALNGKKYDIGEGYETTCKKFTCTKKTGRKGQKKRPKMVKTATGNCCKYEEKQHLQGEEITLPSKRVLSCCKGYWIQFNITSSGQQPACDDDFDPFSFFNGSDANLTQTRDYADSPYWMKSVSNSKRLNELSIPGTHDTMAYQGAATTVWHRTQNRNLWKQLLMGVRFIDIRLKMKGETLGCYHGSGLVGAYLDNDFDDVLYYIYRFLRSYKTETVLMRVSSEGEDDVKDFCKRVNKILTSFSKGLVKLWNSGSNTIWQGNNIPTMGDVRGKLVVLNWAQLPGCFGFRFRKYNTILDNYDGDNNVKWEWWWGRRRRKRESIQEYTNFYENEEIEGFQSVEKNVKTEYTKNLTKSGTELDRKVETGETEGNGNVTTVPPRVPSKDELRSFGVNLTIGVPLKQNRFGWYVPSESYKKELEGFLDKVRTYNSYTTFRNAMTYTWASAFDWRVPNERFAKHVNPRLYRYFKAHRFDRLGVVVFDYIDEWNSDMLKLIYERNIDHLPCAIMYEHCDYNGDEFIFLPEDDIRSLSRAKFNDKASSYSVRYGCWVKFYEHSLFRGRSIGDSGGDSCLVNSHWWLDWNDRISSVKCNC